MEKIEGINYVDEFGIDPRDTYQAIEEMKERYWGIKREELERDERIPKARVDGVLEKIKQKVE
jgi:hypothetical protein